MDQMSVGEKWIHDKWTPKGVCREVIVDTAVFDILPLQDQFFNGQKAVVVYFQEQGFNSFADNVINWWSFNKTKWTDL